LNLFSKPYIDERIQQAQKGVTSTIAKCLKVVFTHIEKNWERLKNDKVSTENTILSEALKIRRWLPVEQSLEQLSHLPAFMVPQNKLYQSDEVCFSPHRFLVASQKPLFVVSKLPEKEFQQALGFLYPSREDVVNHFKALIQLWEEGDSSSFRDEDFERSLQNIYNYFKTTFLSNRVTDTERQWLRNQLQGYKCLWGYVEFWKPEHTFRDNVSFFGKRRQKINPSPNLGEVYKLLGQKQQPGVDDYLGFLEELAKEYQGEPLSADDAKCAHEVLTLLSQDLQREKRSAKNIDFFLLTDDNLLLPPNQMLIPDARWRLDAITDRNQVKILHPEVPYNLAIEAGCRSLLSDVIEKPTQVERTDNQTAHIVCSKWRGLIRSAEFLSGIKRLIADQFELADELSLDWLKKADIQPAATITTELLLDGLCIASGLKGSYYFEPDKRVFYLTDEDEELMRHRLTESLNQQLCCSKLNNTARLLTMLNSKPAEIEYLLDCLKVKTLKQSCSIAVLLEKADENNFDQIFDSNLLDEFGSNDVSNNDEDVEKQKPDYSLPGSSSDDKGLGKAIAQPKIASPIIKSSSQPSTHPIIKPAKPITSGSQKGEILAIRPADFGNASGEAAQDAIANSSIDIEVNSTRQGQSERSIRSRDSSSGNRRVRAKVTPYCQTYRNGVRVHSELKFGSEKRLETQLPVAERNKIDKAGMSRVMEYEYQHGREPQDMNEIRQNHPGYDIKSADGRSREARYIEVKSLRGLWDKRGICMTSTQFKAGNEHQDQYWLYVVEQAETDEAKVNLIKNPVGLVNEFYYDDSWRQLADKEMEELG